MCVYCGLAVWYTPQESLQATLNLWHNYVLFMGNGRLTDDLSLINPITRFRVSFHGC